MKKVLLFGGAMAVLALTSCKKEYECECTSTVSGAGITTTTSTTETTIKDTKKNAEATCNESDASSESFGITTTVECELHDH